MMSDEKITEELRKAYNMMTFEQMEENLSGVEIEPLSAESEQRVKDMVKGKIKMKETKKNMNTKRWIAAAAAFAVVVISAAFCSETVRAAVAKLFGFVPGVGIVEVGEENADRLYILDGTDVSVSDEMVSLEIRNAVIMGDKLELRYTAYLKKISDEDLEKNINTLSDMYFLHGYNKYFVISTLEEDLYQPLTPITGTVLNGTEITPYDIKVTETESLESSRSVCITQTYDIKNVAENGSYEGVLTLGDLSVGFKMKKINLDSTAEDAAGGEQIIETNGVKIMCVPTVKEDKLYIDYYVLDNGEYEKVQGFRGFGNKTDCLTVEGEEIVGWIDESCIFADDSNTSFNRYVYDLDGISEESDTAVLDTYGIYVEKAYENKGVYFDGVPNEKVSVNKAMEFDGLKAYISEMSVEHYGEDQGYEENNCGYLTVRYSVEDSDGMCFANFAKISINGVAVEGFYAHGFDLDYSDLIIPLPVPFEEVRSVEFKGVNLMLVDNQSIEIPLKAE